MVREVRDVSHPSRTQPARARIWWLVICLALHSAGLVVQLWGPNKGIDFYHYWGIATAQTLVPDQPLGSPYASDGQLYADRLNALADASNDRHFKGANAERRTIDPTGTPLFYLSFAWLPSDYSRAHAWFRAGQWLSLVLGFAWFARSLGFDASTAALMAVVTPAFYGPFHSDLAVGNINSFQLLACAALVAGVRRFVTTPRFLLACALACALAAFVVFKPNVAPIAAALAAPIALVFGVRRTALVALVGVAFGAALVLLSGARFGGLSAWSEWYAYLSGPTGSKLADYTVLEGNYAPAVVWVERALHPDHARWTYGLCAALAGVLGASWLIALFVGRKGASLRERVQSIGRDPHALLAAALTFTLAASPLGWFHYCVLALLPIAWCVRPGERAWFRRSCGLVSWVAYACLFVPFFSGPGQKIPEFTPTVVALAWIPLWLAVLVGLARRDPVAS
jgi:hypothetical protein